MKNLRNQRGQALLIVVLVMAVALTIGLAVVSRSITDIKISRQEEESARVFSVAEAGIEEALKLGSGTSGTIGEGEALIGYTVSETGQGGGTEFVFPAINAGDTQTVWLVEHDNDGNLTETGRYTGNTIDLYWGNENQDPNQSTTPALEVSVIYKEGTSYKLTRGAFDPNSSRRNDNSFDEADVGSYSIGGKTFRFRKLGFTLPGGTPYAVRLRLIYNLDQAQILGVADNNADGAQNFPSQGKCYESTASLSTSGITRKVQQCQFHKTPPGIFDYVLFSEGGLTK